MELTGRTTLVTGAGRRVGRAIALRLARAGSNVAVHYNRSAEEAETVAAAVRAHGVEAFPVQADLADPEATRGLVPAVLERLGRLDVLVNNAAVFPTMKLGEFDLAAWNHVLQVNLTAPMMLTYAAEEELRRNRGRVVNLCDVAVGRPWPDHLGYIVSKGGLETLTKALARALAPEVNVVGVAPGVAAWPPDYSEAFKEHLLERVPAKRAGSPEDIAAAVEYLVTAGDYVTGAILPVDGGRHVV